MRWIIGLIALLFVEISYAQSYASKDFVAPDVYENIAVKPIQSDDLSSTFVIWVKREVKSHKHEEHTEVVFVLKGKGEMKVGEETKKIKKGDVVIIPHGTIHSVRTTSRKPLQVISAQSPNFDGTDRIMIDN
jgi:mannose-6-phosphate isomerase-like protein (cupin superfamily)